MPFWIHPCHFFCNAPERYLLIIRRRALFYKQNEMVFQVMEICIFVFQLMFCIVVVFFVYSTKGGHLENDKCKNVELTTRHDI